MDSTVADEIGQALSERKSVHLEAQISQHRENIDNYSERCTNLTQEITMNLGRMRDERDMLDIAKAAADDNTFAQHLAEEWAELRKHPRLASASIEHSQLTLVTTPDIRLHCEDREDTRWLGAFEIILNLNNGQITLNNLNTRRGGRDHPHVVNGNPCFGGDHAVFAQLLSDGHLNVLFEMLLQYLEKLNLRDEYGRYGAYWFDQEDAQPEQTIPMEVATA